jgi:tellurite resistance protein TehA-like permease
MATVSNTGPVLAHSRRQAFSLATFFPGYFALVMATGIVSITAHLHGLDRLATALFWLNLAFYAGLWVLTLLRFLNFREQLVDDLTHHARGPAFLTKVAATCVLGSQFAGLTPWLGVAKGLWFFGVALWVVLSYAFFTAIIVREHKPPLETGIHGGWLLIVVSTESLCVLGATLGSTSDAGAGMLLVALLAHLLGAMLYIVLITLILYRWMFFTLTAEQMMPPYWINMGALAITTLAGTRLLLAQSKWPLLRDLAPFLTGSTLLFWAAGSWWIPLLLLVGAWRHLWRRVPFSYEPQYWSLVFPLGMYSAATWMLGQVVGIAWLHSISAVFLVLALAVWAVTLMGMLTDWSRIVRQ